MTVAAASTPRTSEHRVDLPGVVASEWVKFRGLLSNWLIGGFVFLLLVANGVAMPWAYVFRDRGSPQADYDAYPEMIVDKTGYVGVVLVILAALLVTSEYRSGQISATLLAVPTRVPVLVAKLLVVGAIAFVIGVVTSAIGFAVAPAILAGGGYSYSLDGADALRLVLGSGLYLATLSTIGIAAGVLIRNVVAAVLASIVFLVIVPIVPQMFSQYGTEVTRFFPIQAGSLLIARHGTDPMGPWLGYLVLAGWSAALFVVAVLTVKRRDA